MAGGRGAVTGRRIRMLSTNHLCDVFKLAVAFNIISFLLRPVVLLRKSDDVIKSERTCQR